MMGIRFFLVGVVLATLLCIISFLIILFFFNPFEVGAVIIALFYLSLFLSLVGIFGLAGFFLKSLVAFFRRKIVNKDLSFHKDLSDNFLQNSLRRGALLAILITGGLWLESREWLSWVTGLILLVVIIALEAFFLRKR